MTKKEIVKQIAERINETQLKTKEIVQLTFDAIVDTLIADRRIELRNFGVFEVKLRKARKARNPRTDDPVDVPPKFVVTFKPGKVMEEQVRRLIPTAAELAVLEKPKAAPAPIPAPAASSELPPPPRPGEPASSTEPSVGDFNGSADGTDSQAGSKKKRARKTTQV